MNAKDEQQYAPQGTASSAAGGASSASGMVAQHSATPALLAAKEEAEGSVSEDEDKHV